ncbi:MAG: SBBP repeat-containing protein [Sedimentisphaerales bacterium]|nr:SBBP repeat-containing protein [Sedimentisphaerales bacterium]
MPPTYSCHNAVAVDSAGCAYVCSLSVSPQDPATFGAFDTTHNGGHNVYLLKLDPTGSRTLWATYLGGKSDDRPKDLTVDAAGNVYVTGRTNSDDFPTTQTAVDRSPNGHYDMFLAVIDASGGKLLYSTVMGGKSYDTGETLVLDRHNGLYIAGTTRSADFPTTENAYERVHSGYKASKFGGDVFVCKFNFRVR